MQINETLSLNHYENRRPDWMSESACFPYSLFSLRVVSILCPVWLLLAPRDENHCTCCHDLRPAHHDARHCIANRGQASIGYGLPGAIGAKVACPDKTVITLSGDGGLAYSIMEMETAVSNHIPVILIVVNNKCLGYIKALEHLQYGEYISTDLNDIHSGSKRNWVWQ